MNCRNLINCFFCICCCICCFAGEAFAWHPTVQSTCKQEDGSTKVVFGWVGDGSTYTIAAGMTGSSSNTCTQKSGSKTYNRSGSTCTNFFSPDPKARSGQPTVFPAGNVSSFFTTSFTTSSLTWKVGPSTAKANKSYTNCPVPDCKGVINGPNKVDQCGVCDADPSNDNKTCKDCKGVINGSSKVDECGVCGGPGKTGCDHKCGSTKVVDECGVCGGNNSSCIDCKGITNGHSENDQCGVCGGDNSTCKDCAGTINGSKVIDQCGVCGGDNSTCKDCAGVVNGSSKVDLCGICGGDSSSCQDCAGVPNGNAVIDACGVCGGASNTCLDCAGVPNGSARLDECGVCNGDGSSCRCPLVPVDYNVIDLVTQLKVIANEKTIEYFAKGYKCASKKLQKAVASAVKSLAKANKNLAKANITLAKALATGNPKKITKAQKSFAKSQAAVVKATNKLNAAIAGNNSAFSKIETVRNLLQEYIELANSLPTTVELCPGDCVDLMNKETLDRMAWINETIYAYASDAQHSARRLCRIKGPGNKGTRPLTDKLHGDIESCHGKDKVCR